MKRYNPKQIEPKWQRQWHASGIYRAIDFSDKPKYVMLTEFPYPSGAGMHIGHMREYTIGDIIARHRRMQGDNVLFPMGYDAFGLPTENFAIKNKVSPQQATEENVANFQTQLESMGFSFDWSRSFKTSDPDYYKWTQWLFLRFFEAGLAYRAEVAVNWCPFCKTGLANEEVVNGRHERCDTPVEKKMLNQWMLKITDYADRLIEGLNSVDYPSRIADQQVNWIGRSKGAEIDFPVAGSKATITVFTTRPDTIYGATFIVLAPEHPLVETLTKPAQKERVRSYISSVQTESEIDRQDTEREKTGMFTGSYAINPLTKDKIPIWIADYILMGYGTGAIMAVPAHDERDRQFAEKFNLPIQYVVEPVGGKVQGDEIEKDAVVAVLKDPTTQDVLLLDWGPRRDRYGGMLFIGGGINRGETAAEAAEREIKEETGYLDIKLTASLPYTVHNYYYSNVKQKNYYARIRGYLFELTSNRRARQRLDKDEQDKFTLKWVDQYRASRLVVDEGHAHIYDALVNGKVFVDEGVMVNSGKYDKLPSSAAREKIVADLIKQGLAREKVNYRLRDWIFSRQHYWGEPIPIIHCPKHGPVAVPDDQLPVELPIVEHYEPTKTGESPLASIEDWVNTTCPVCGLPAKRETDTMPNWAGSSWYYLRYFDPHNNERFAERSKLDYWGAVDLYVGGMEHTTLHLLYSRFWHQFLYDRGLVPTAEPYAARRGQGIILAADGTKMSKSKGNIVNPTDVIDSGYGADALRLAITFLAPYDQTTPWSPEAIAGTFRFLQRLWTLVQHYGETSGGTIDSDELMKIVNRTVKKVSADLLSMSFNTAIASLMECVNELYKVKAVDNYAATQWQWALETIVKLTAPFAPHIGEELWHDLGNDESVHVSGWPGYDESYIQTSECVIAVQVNGKLRGQVMVGSGADQAEVLKTATADSKISRYLDGRNIVKVIYVPNKLISLVVR